MCKKENRYSQTKVFFFFFLSRKKCRMNSAQIHQTSDNNNRAGYSLCVCWVIHLLETSMLLPSNVFLHIYSAFYSFPCIIQINTIFSTSLNVLFHFSLQTFGIIIRHHKRKRFVQFSLCNQPQHNFFAHETQLNRCACPKMKNEVPTDQPTEGTCTLEIDKRRQFIQFCTEIMRNFSNYNDLDYCTGFWFSFIGKPFNRPEKR